MFGKKFCFVGENSPKSQKTKDNCPELKNKVQLLNEKSDARFGRVNTFHILQIIRKGPSKNSKFV
jgi:hypothetical protein